MAQDPRFFSQPISLTEKFKALNENFPAFSDEIKKGIAERLIQDFDAKVSKLNHSFCSEMLSRIGECDFLDADEKGKLAKDFIVENTNKKTLGAADATYLYMATEDNASLEYLKKGTPPVFKDIKKHLDEIAALSKETQNEIAAVLAKALSRHN